MVNQLGGVGTACPKTGVTEWDCLTLNKSAVRDLTFILDFRSDPVDPPDDAELRNFESWAN